MLHPQGFGGAGANANFSVNSLTTPSLDTFAKARLARIEAAGRLRTPRQTRPLGGAAATRNGRRLISFSSNDYLGLREAPAVRSAAVAAIAEYGAGAGASYLVTGNHPLYAQLEYQLAKFKGTEAACIFGSGYLANIGTIPTFAGPDDLLLVDELSHACIRAGARLAGSTLQLFAHNDVLDLQRKLRQHRGAFRNALVVTEGVFSMDGDVAPLSALSTLAHEYDAWLMVDDAHGFGVLGAGRGSAFISGVPVAVDIQMGTLSKALGSYGGFVCASRPVVDLLRNRARSFIYSTALPPASVAAAVAALGIIAAEPGLTAVPVAKAHAFSRAVGLRAAESPIVPLIVGESERAMDAAAMLEERGFLVVPIRPPTVAEGSARLRVCFSALHGDDDVERLAEVVRKYIVLR
jgi:8-amino-7-oxononanoate synthase